MNLENGNPQVIRASGENPGVIAHTQKDVKNNIDEKIQKEKAVEKFKYQLITIGNLSSDEIDELILFNFFRGPISIKEQLRKYYLEYKNTFGEKSSKFLNDIQQHENSTDVEEICKMVYKYVSGPVIHYKGSVYSINSSGFFKIS